MDQQEKKVKEKNKQEANWKRKFRFNLGISKNGHLQEWPDAPAPVWEKWLVSTGMSGIIMAGILSTWQYKMAVLTFSRSSCLFLSLSWISVSLTAEVELSDCCGGEKEWRRSSSWLRFQCEQMRQTEMCGVTPWTGTALSSSSRVSIDWSKWVND